MSLTVFLLVALIYVILISFSYLIEETNYKIYYFAIIVLATLVFLNIYIGIIYYTKLRNEPGVPGPPGPKGDKGPSGAKGKCIATDKCGLEEPQIDEILFEPVAQKFQADISCLKTPNITNCGTVSEFERIKPVSDQVRLLEELAKTGGVTKDELQYRVNKTLETL
jgi:hypothetical protein